MEGWEFADSSVQQCRYSVGHTHLVQVVADMTEEGDCAANTLVGMTRNAVGKVVDKAVAVVAGIVTEDNRIGFALLRQERRKSDCFECLFLWEMFFSQEFNLDTVDEIGPQHGSVI